MNKLSALKRQRDQWLVREYVDGGDEAFDVLAERYLGRLNAVVFSALFRYTGRAGVERRERLVCDALVKAALNIRQCRRPELFGRWLMRIAVNVVVDDCRKTGRRRERTCSQLRVGENGAEYRIDCADPHYPSGGVLDIICRAERAERLAPDIVALVECLPEKQRRVVLMRIRDGMSNKEIARLMGLDQRTVSSHLAQARKTLRQCIDRLNPDEMQRSEETDRRRSYALSSKGAGGASASLSRLPRVPARGCRH